MKTVKTCELIGPALDWATAKADVGYDIDMSFIYTEGGKAPFYCFSPSTRWDQCGPLIDKYKATTWHKDEDHDETPYCASIRRGVHYWSQRAESTLIALCRVIVEAELGDTVQIPDELWTAQNDTEPPSRPDSKDAGPAN